MLTVSKTRADVCICACVYVVCVRTVVFSVWGCVCSVLLLPKTQTRQIRVATYTLGTDTPARNPRFAQATG